MGGRWRGEWVVGEEWVSSVEELEEGMRGLVGWERGMWEKGYSEVMMGRGEVVMEVGRVVDGGKGVGEKVMEEVGGVWDGVGWV